MGEGTESDNEPVEEFCRKMANYRIDFVRPAGPDHAFCCEDHLKEILVPVLNVACGPAARVSGLPSTSEESCEFGVG